MKKWKGFLTTHCVLVAFMALSLEVLAWKCCFPSLLEFSALIISCFGMLFIGSVTLVSLHARQDTKCSTGVCTEIFLWSFTEKENPEKSCQNSSSEVSDPGSTWVQEGKSPPKAFRVCLRHRKSSLTSPHPAKSFVFQHCLSGLFL